MRQHCFASLLDVLYALIFVQHEVKGWYTMRYYTANMNQIESHDCINVLPYIFSMNSRYCFCTLFL